MTAVEFTGDPHGVAKEAAAAQAAIDALPPARLNMTKMQALHLFALGHIDGKGRRLVEMDVLLAALRKYREKR